MTGAGVPFDPAGRSFGTRPVLRWPQVDPAVAAVGGPFTAVKRVTGFVAFTALVVLGVAELVRRRGGPRAGSNTAGP